jgi:hypothetical protein
MTIKGIRKMVIAILALSALIAADYLNLDATTRMLLTAVAVVHLGIQGAVDLTETRYEEPIDIEYKR